MIASPSHWNRIGRLASCSVNSYRARNGPPIDLDGVSDDLKLRGGQDRTRINLEQDHEVRYWTKASRLTSSTRRWRWPSRRRRVLWRRVGDAL